MSSRTSKYTFTNPDYENNSKIQVLYKHPYLWHIPSSWNGGGELQRMVGPNRSEVT